MNRAQRTRTQGSRVQKSQGSGVLGLPAREGRAEEQLDIGIGFLGFWGFVLMVTVIWQELSGASAWGWALLLAVVVVIMALMFRSRARLQRKAQD